MNLLLKTMSLVCVLLFASRCTNEQGEEKKVLYYTKLTGIISPYFKYKPRGKITKETALQMGHYRATYDLSNRLVELSFYKGNTRSNESYFRAHTVRYKYGNRSLSRSYYNTNGKKTYMWRHYYMGGPIHKEVFSLDDRGKKVALTFEDSLANPAVTSLGTALITWRTLSETTFVQTQFDAEGNPNLLTGYFPFYTSKITLDSNGHLSKIENIDESGALVPGDSAGYAAVPFNFDEYGNELSWEFHDVEGNLVNRVPFRDMDYGYAKWTYSKYWRDRELGLVDSVSEKYFDWEDLPTENNFSIHEVVYTMTEFGDLNSIAYYGKDRLPRVHPLHGCFRMVYHYNPMGDLDHIERFDHLGEVVK